MNILRRTIGGILAGAVAGSMASLPVSPAALAEETRPITVTVDIPAQDVSEALNEFAKQSGLQVVFYTNVAQGMRAPEVKGTLDSTVALERILSATPLTYQFLNDRTVAVSAPGNGQGVTENGQKAEGTRKDLATSLGVQAEGAQVAGGNARATGQEGATQTSGDTGPAIGELAEVRPTALPEILVENSRSLNADIRRTESGVQPYVVFDREEIEVSQALNLEEFLRARLPMNTVQDSQSQSAGASVGNQSRINLRGLGTDETLILVDGRRMPGIYIGSSDGFAQPDINGIPLAAIERIEVLPSTAGGIYGGGATGGVVNIILRRDYAGLELKASYENSFESDTTLRRLDMNGGFPLEAGRTHVTFAASYAVSNSLLTGERNFAARGRALQEANNPAAFGDLPRGYTTNICSANVDFGFAFCDGMPLILDDGTELGASIASVPVGYAGPESDGGAAFLETAGRYNYALPADLSGTRRSILNNPTIKSIAANVRRTFHPRVEGFLDLSWFNNGGRSAAEGGVDTFPSEAGFGPVFLPADAPNNPFNAPIAVSIPAPGLEFDFLSDSDVFRAAGGIIVRLPHDWAGQVEYNWNQSRFDYSTTDPAISSSASAAIAAGTLDVLSDVNVFPLNYSPYLLSGPNRVGGPFDTVLNNALARLAGPAFMLPGGPIYLTGLIEHRQEESQDAFEHSLAGTEADSPIQRIFHPSRSQRVNSAYLEAQVPLYSSINALRGVRELEFQASIRYDKYKTTSPVSNVPPLSHATNQVDSTDYTLGLRYQPLSDLTLRVSFGTGFLPPTIHQIAQSSFQDSFVIGPDPKRPDGALLIFGVDKTFGGNPALAPESSETFSAGFIVTPSVVPGFRWSIDYTRIDKRGEIAQLEDYQILALEDFLPGRVTRAPLSDADIALGFTAGRILSLDSSLLNLSKTRVEAFDLQVDQELETDHFGVFNFYAVATLATTFERQLTPASMFADAVGFSDPGAPLEWRGNAGINWQRGSWTIGWNAQYYDSYSIALADPTLALQNPSRILSQGAELIPSQLYHDAFVRYRTGNASSAAHGVFANMEVLLGIQNLFNEEPPIIATTEAFGYSAYGDPRLRRYSVVVQKNF